MRAYMCGLLLCSVVITGLAENRQWFTNPYSSGAGMGVDMNSTWVQQSWQVVYSNFPVGVNPIPPIGSVHGVDWSRTFMNFGGTIWSLYYVDTPADANTLGAPLVEPVLGSNYYLTWNCEITPANTYGPKVPGNSRYAYYYDYGKIIAHYSTNGPPPPPDYYCYFDLEGVAFFDGQTNKSFQAELFVASAIDNTYPGPWSSKGIFLHGISGAYLDSVYYKLGTIESAYNAFYKWVIRVLGQLQPEELPQAMTSLSNPNGFHYVTKLDFTDYNTNSPYVPPVPTNSPPDPYIPYPGDDAYDPETPPGPWPPYYSPWPPYYYPPPPLTEWPQYPPPNWPYNTNSPYNPPGPDDPTPDPNNPTNYPNPDPGNTNGAGGGYTLAQWYAMLRSALSDEANSYIPSDPAQYGLTYSNDLLRTVNDYTTKYFAESDKIQTDADAFLVKAKGILDVVSLPLPNVGIKESFSFTFPYLNQVVEIKTSDWPIIGVFRTFMKWIMALLSFWVAFIMIKRTFGRV